MRSTGRFLRAVITMEKAQEPRSIKLTGRAFYESIGSPKMVLAPMVDQSEFVGRSSTALG